MELSGGKNRSGSFFSVVLLMLFTANLMLAALLAAPRGHYSIANITNIPDDTVAAQPVQGRDADIVNTDRLDLQMILEWRLENIKVSGDYEIQTYREYEIYKDKQGKIVETIPTSHLEYLRYWRYR